MCSQRRVRDIPRKTSLPRAVQIFSVLALLQSFQLPSPAASFCIPPNAPNNITPTPFQRRNQLLQPGRAKKTTCLQGEFDVDEIDSIAELNELSESVGGPDLMGCATLDEARDILWDHAQAIGSEDHNHEHEHDHSDDEDEEEDDDNEKIYITVHSHDD